MRQQGDQHTPIAQKTHTWLFWDSLPSEPGRVGVACPGAYPGRSQGAVGSVSSLPEGVSRSPLREFEQRGYPSRVGFLSG